MTSAMGEADQGRNGNLVVFISYSRSDSAACESIVKSLEANDISVLVDRRDLPYGEEWQGELAHFIASCDRAIWLVSQASITSRWCSWELEELRRLAKKIVPVRVQSIGDAELPESLAKIHVLPAIGTFDEQTHLELLLDSLLSNSAWVKQATRLSNAAQEWRFKEREDGLLLRGLALREAENWVAATPNQSERLEADVLEFVLASRQLQDKEEIGRARFRKRLFGGIGAVALIVVALSWASWFQWQKADTESKRATNREIGDLAMQWQGSVYDLGNRKRGPALALKVAAVRFHTAEALNEAGRTSDAIKMFEWALEALDSDEFDKKDPVYLKLAADASYRLFETTIFAPAGIDRPKLLLRAVELYDELCRLSGSPVAYRSKQLDVLQSFAQFSRTTDEEVALRRQGEAEIAKVIGLLRNVDIRWPADRLQLASSLGNISFGEVSSGGAYRKHRYQQELELRALELAIELSSNQTVEDIDRFMSMTSYISQFAKMANLYFDTEQYEKAQQSAERYKELRREHKSVPFLGRDVSAAEVDFTLGKTLFRQGKTDEGADLLRAVIAAYRKDPFLWGDLAYRAWRHNEPLAWLQNEYAVSERFQECASLTDDFIIVAEDKSAFRVSFNANAGWCEVAAGNFDKALKVLSKARELQPNDLPTQTNLAHALMFLGREKEALDLYQRNIGRVIEDAGSWEEVIRQDFDTLRRHGHDHPQMVEVLNLFKAKSGAVR